MSNIKVTHDRLTCKVKMKNGESVVFTISRGGESFKVLPSEVTPKCLNYTILLNKLYSKYRGSNGENNLERMQRFNNDMIQFSSINQLSKSI